MPETVLVNVSTTVNNLNTVLVILAITSYCLESNNKQTNKKLIDDVLYNISMMKKRKENNVILNYFKGALIWKA